MTNCEFCDSVMEQGERRCPSCGAAASVSSEAEGSPSVVHHHHHSSEAQQGGVSPKARVVAGLLGFFLGGLGIHNFYLGYTGRGICQLILTCTIIGWWVSGIWAFIETIIIFAGNPKDAKGLPLVY